MRFFTGGLSFLLRRLYLIQQQRRFHQEVVVELAVLVVYHQQAGGIPGGGLRVELLGGDGVQPVLQVVGAQVGPFDAAIDDHRKFVEGEEVVGFLVEVLLQVDDIHAIQAHARFFAQEQVAAAVEGDKVFHLVLLDIGEEELLDPLMHRLQLAEEEVERLFIQLEFFLEGAGAAGFHVDHLLGSRHGVAQLIHFGIDADVINVQTISPGLDKYFIAAGVKNQQGDFGYGKEIGEAAVYVAIFQFEDRKIGVHVLVFGFVRGINRVSVFSVYYLMARKVMNFTFIGPFFYVLKSF